MRSERKAAVLVIMENIEMELFSSEERATVTQTQEEKRYSPDQVSVNLKKSELQENSLVFSNRLLTGLKWGTFKENVLQVNPKI